MTTDAEKTIDQLAREAAAWAIVDAMRAIDRVGERAANEGLRGLADVQAGASLLLAGFFEQLTGRRP